jgi:hypothetical protein
MKNVINLLSHFHYPLLVSDRVRKFMLGSYLGGYGGSFLSPSTL